MVINAKYYTLQDSNAFTCKFTNISYKKTKDMLRRYDFRFMPTHISEKLHFEEMKCTYLYNYSDAIDINSELGQNLTFLLTEYSLKSVSDRASTVITEFHFRNISTLFLKKYRELVLRKLINKCVMYLENLSLNFFNVIPSMSSSVNEHYNIRIENLFNYNPQYSLSLNDPYSLKFMGKYIHRTPPTGFLIISSKNNSNEVIIKVQSIEFYLILEVTWINKVQKLNIIDVNVTINKFDQEYSSDILSLIKYLNIELAKEFKRSFIFLTEKIDFYSLNVL